MILAWALFRKSTPARFAAMALVLATPGGFRSGYANTNGQGRAKGTQRPGTTDYDVNYDVSRRDMIRAIGELYQAEATRQEEMSMESAVMCDNGPKEISVYCHQAPEVKIVDLAQDHRGNNQCLVLNINAPDVSSKIVLKCDGSIGDDDFGWGEDW